VSVLQRKELEDSPLADLHAIASELGIDGYRALRRGDLVAAILDIQGGDANGDRAADRAADTARRGEVDDAPEAEQAEGEVDDEPEADGDSSARAETVEPADREPADREPADEDSDADHERVAGILDVLSNGSGFVRREDGPDVYVSPAQIRRCELRPGDELSGPVRPRRRNERHPSLVRVESVNGRDPEPPEQRPDFAELTPVHPGERLAAAPVLDAVPFGKGSRVAIAGVPGAGATTLLRQTVAAVSAGSGDLALTVALIGVRPEEVTDWRRGVEAPIVGGSYEGGAEQQAQAAELAVERGKRVAERGGDAVVVLDSLAAVEPAQARRLLGAGRKLEEGGSLTVVAAVGDSSELLRIASTRVVLESGAAEPRLDPARSGTQRPELLR
jgi:transcription termination factor Rho